MNMTQQSVMSGLTTDTIAVATAGVYSMYARATEVPISGVVITLSQSGSTTASFTSLTTSPVEQVVTVNGKFNCQVGDILTIAVTSSATQDQPPNLIKTTCLVRQGL